MSLWFLIEFYEHPFRSSTRNSRDILSEFYSFYSRDSSEIHSNVLPTEFPFDIFPVVTYRFFLSFGILLSFGNAQEVPWEINRSVASKKYTRRIEMIIFFVNFPPNLNILVSFISEIHYLSREYSDRLFRSPTYRDIRISGLMHLSNTLHAIFGRASAMWVLVILKLPKHPRIIKCVDYEIII